MDVIINHGGKNLTDCLGINFETFEKKVKKLIGETINEANREVHPTDDGEELEVSGKVSNISQKLLDNFTDAEILALATSLVTADVKENLERMHNPTGGSFEEFLDEMRKKVGKMGAQMEVIKVPREDTAPKHTNITLTEKKKDSES